MKIGTRECLSSYDSGLGGAKQAKCESPNLPSYRNLQAVVGLGNLGFFSDHHTHVMVDSK